MKEKLFIKAIRWMTKKGFKEIKANTEAFEKPVPFSNPNADHKIFPDITGRKHGRKSYMEIVSKEADIQSLVTKWKLLSVVASRKGGKLYLLAGRGSKTFTSSIIKTHNLTNTQIVNIQ
jgi:hypothetical protein